MQNIITVSRPQLTPTERARRMEIIKKAAADLVIATETAKRKKAKQCEKC
jgi:hypothetical protein